MALTFEDRPSESAYIERVWRSRSEAVDTMTSIATAHWTLVCWRDRRDWRIAVQGPETRASAAPVPLHAEFIGIRFALGTTLAPLSIDRIVDHGIVFPDAASHSIRLFGHRLPLPGYDDAEDLVRQLVRIGVVVRDPMVRDAINGLPAEVTTHTMRRHFVRATGLTPVTVRQIERSREAALLIRSGAPIGDVAHGLGYYDQPHLARATARFIGHTATDLRSGAAGQLSLLYATRADTLHSDNHQIATLRTSC